MGVDVFDLFFKTADFIFFMSAMNTSYEQEKYFAPMSTALAVALLVICCATVWRIREIREMGFVANHGFSKRWKKGTVHCKIALFFTWLISSILIFNLKKSLSIFELCLSNALKGERIAGTTSGADPRVRRDMEERIKRIQQLSVIVAITCDLPWLSIAGMVKKVVPRLCDLAVSSCRGMFKQSSISHLFDHPCISLERDRPQAQHLWHHFRLE